MLPTKVILSIACCVALLCACNSVGQKYYAGMCGVDGCECYGQLHYKGECRYPINNLKPDTIVIICGGDSSYGVIK